MLSHKPINAESSGEWPIVVCWYLLKVDPKDNPALITTKFWVDEWLLEVMAWKSSSRKHRPRNNHAGRRGFQNFAENFGQSALIHAYSMGIPTTRLTPLGMPRFIEISTELMNSYLHLKHENKYHWCHHLHECDLPKLGVYDWLVVCGYGWHPAHASVPNVETYIFVWGLTPYGYIAPESTPYPKCCELIPWDNAVVEPNGSGCTNDGDVGVGHSEE